MSADSASTAAASPESTKRRKLSESMAKVDDVRIDFMGPLLPPACVIEDVHAEDDVLAKISAARASIHAAVVGQEDRVVVIVGPCSVHDVSACKEYAEKLAEVAKEVVNEVIIVMRVYFEKPRTTVGWKGLINDPHMNGTFKINRGLKIARQFLLDVNKIGLPCGVEFLDTISPQFLADLVSWGAIGARTTESQVHRELASGLSCPVGFKNGTSGDVQVAVDACGSASKRHSFLSVTKQGLAAIVHTKGNRGCHVILRGGSNGTNYAAGDIAAATALARKSGCNDRLMVDCSHGNSNKNHKNQPLVAEEVCRQIAAGDNGIMGLMIESHLNEGKQKMQPGETDVADLKRGVSITDACIDFAETKIVLHRIADAVKQRRVANASK